MTSQQSPPGDTPSAARLSAPPSFAELPRARVEVDLASDGGALELWRHSVGHGGINSLPLPERVVEGAARLRLRLVRIFIQEFFAIYPDHGRFDWSRLDPYMESFARTGAKVAAAITIKPKPLYPRIDQRVWQPADEAEWQQVVEALVRRYSVERPIVTHWEVGNETDIGENGGCPFLIPDPADYARYYRLTVAAIRRAFPQAKIGGAAVADGGGDYLPAFIEICRKEGLPLDFVSWHLYSDDAERHAGLVNKYRRLLEGFGDRRPEMLVTEWNKSFEPVSVEEAAFNPRRAAVAAAAILAMDAAGVDWSFYYHLWDQVCYQDEFLPFFAKPEIMLRHWNEIPHRFGLFGVEQEVRPQYFLFRMLERMQGSRAGVATDAGDLQVLASHDGDRDCVLMVNHAPPGAPDRIVTVAINGLSPGRQRLTLYRIDRGRSWSSRELELLPVERREVDVPERFQCQLFCPGESVCQLILEPVRA
jgi:hypothetical protein